MIFIDNGGRRSRSDRRQIAVNNPLMERRSEKERRKIPDRRSGLERRSPKGVRFMMGLDRRATFRPLAYE